MRHFSNWHVRGLMGLQRRLDGAGSRNRRVAIVLGRAGVDSYGVGCAWLVSASRGNGSVGAGSDYRKVGGDHGGSNVRGDHCSSEVGRDHGSGSKDDAGLDIRCDGGGGCRNDGGADLS